MRNFSVYPLVLTNPGHELDDYAARLTDDANYYVTGMYGLAVSFINRMSDKLGIINYIKNDLEVMDGSYPGVFSDDPGLLKDIHEGKARIICTERNRDGFEKSRKYWAERGAELNLQFFQDEVFEAIYNVYKSNKVILDRVEVFLTSRCTLNCEKCIAYIPYFRMKKDVDIELLKADVDVLFSKVDYVRKLKLLGGEGFLYPNLMDYLEYVYDKYSDKIGTIRIGTNGTVIPKEEVLKVCKKCGVIADISDYSHAVPGVCKLEETRKKLESYGIATEIKRTGEQWLDMGFPNDIPDKRSEEENRDHFRKCAMFCRQFSRGKLYFCCSNFAAVEVGLFSADENDYFDFDRTFSKKELLEFELGYSPIGHTTFCKVCRGCSEEANDMHVEVAKQADGILTASPYYNSNN